MATFFAHQVLVIVNSRLFVRNITIPTVHYAYAQCARTTTAHANPCMQPFVHTATMVNHDHHHQHAI